MVTTVKDFIRTCVVCQKQKSETIAPAALLSPLPILEAIWEDISMDFVEGLPKSDGKNVIYVVVDGLSKFAHFIIPMSNSYSVVHVARIFLKQIQIVWVTKINSVRYGSHLHI